MTIETNDSRTGIRTAFGTFGLCAAGGRITALTFSPPETERILPEDAEIGRAHV